MKTLKTIFSIVSLFTSIAANAQTIENYSFSDFPASLSNRQKAKLNLESNKLGKTFKTKITQEYKTGKVNFAGHYIVIDIYKGGGAMVDINNGKIYDCPFWEGPGMGCDESFEYPQATYKNSRMIVYSECSQNMENEKFNDIIYYVYIWDEAKKQFSNVKEIKKRVKNNS